jgi:ATP-dependent Lon protease
VTITGRLGDVMRESAMAALSWIRTNAASLGLDESIFDKSDFHIHVPAGATPKDGPSGRRDAHRVPRVAADGLPVPSDLAMTGRSRCAARSSPSAESRRRSSRRSPRDQHRHPPRQEREGPGGRQPPSVRR